MGRMSVLLVRVVRRKVVRMVRMGLLQPETKKRKIERRPVVATVDGWDILHDKAGGCMKRLTTICPIHPECSKKRAQNTNQTKNYGPEEPFLYLACWMDKRFTFETAKDHISWNPGKRDMQTVLNKEPRPEVCRLEDV